MTRGKDGGEDDSSSPMREEKPLRDLGSCVWIKHKGKVGKEGSTEGRKQRGEAQWPPAVDLQPQRVAKYNTLTSLVHKVHQSC